MIAFSAELDIDYGNWNIYVMDSDGGNLRRLTDSQTYGCTRPHWSPDGQHLLFRSMSVGQNPQLPAESHVMNSDGSNVRQLTFHTSEDQVRFATWLPDGRIALQVREGWYAAILSPDSLERSELPIPQNEYVVVSRSPDQQQVILVTKEPEFNTYYVANADGSDIRRAPNDVILKRDPVWSPDGAHIAFVSRTNETDMLCVMDSDWSNIRPLAEIALHGDFSWSPNGQYITFLGYGQRGYRLYVAAADGSQTYALDAPGDHVGELSIQGPCWSPDSRYLAFNTYMDEGMHIYRIATDGSGLRHLVGRATRFALIYDLDWGS